MEGKTLTEEALNPHGWNLTWKQQPELRGAVTFRETLWLCTWTWF